MGNPSIGPLTRETKGGDPGPGTLTTRRIFLLAMLALGALVSFAAVSRYVAPPEPAVVARHGPNPTRDTASEHGASGHAEPGPMPAAARPATPDTVDKEWGVRVVRLTLIAAGGLVDLRYEVTDPGKASGVMDPEQPAYLLDEASGKAVTTARFPKLGNLRPHAGGLEAGRVYFMGFSNPQGMFEPGDRVTLAVGDRRLEHLTVR